MSNQNETSLLAPVCAIIAIVAGAIVLTALFLADPQVEKCIHHTVCSAGFPAWGNIKTVNPLTGKPQGEVQECHCVVIAAP